MLKNCSHKNVQQQFTNTKFKPLYIFLLQKQLVSSRCHVSSNCHVDFVTNLILTFLSNFHSKILIAKYSCILNTIQFQILNSFQYTTWRQGQVCVCHRAFSNHQVSLLFHGNGGFVPSTSTWLLVLMMASRLQKRKQFYSIHWVQRDSVASSLTVQKL